MNLRLVARWRAAPIALLIAGLLNSCHLFSSDPCEPRVWVPQERILLTSFAAPEFLHGRRFWVLLPRDYSSASARYPVLYMLDGQDLFGPASHWRVDQTAEHLMETREIPKVIIVGIENARGAARTFEYTPWEDSSYGPAPSGGGDAFLRAVADTLIPLVNRRFRTLTGPANTYLMGASFGGLIAVYAGYACDSVFSRVAGMSPSYWWREGLLIDFARVRPRGGLVKFYQDTGTASDDQSPYWLNQMSTIARSQGFIDGRDLLTVIAPGEHHSPGCWGHRLPEALKFLLGPP